jgi:hypothetical protein
MLASPVPKPARAWRRHALILLVISSFPLAAAAAVGWWLTVPLRDDAPTATPAQAAPAAGGKEPEKRDIPDWPPGRLEGHAANLLLLDMLLQVRKRLEGVAGYTATFRKQERINGVLGPELTTEMKLRHHPFAVYFKYLAPNQGKEVVYADGHHGNKIIAHSGGLARLLVPRLAVAPDHPLALAETRHPITEVGLANLTAKLIGFRELDRNDPEAVTILDRTEDAQGHPWLRSIHIHPHFDSHRPFARVEVLYDPETRLPLQIQSYDWPRRDHEGELLLAERYVYENLDLKAVLTPLDFDPANPAYAFHRY